MTTDEEKPAEKPAEEPAPKKDEAKAGKDRTRSIVMMVLATAGLTIFLTLIPETIFRPKTQPPPARSSDSTSTTAPPPLVTPSAELHAITAGTIIVSVSSDKILVDGIEVARTGPFIASDKQQLIPPLKTAMDQKATGNPANQKVGLLIEKGMNKNVIRSVFLTLRLSGFRDVHLIVDVEAGAALLEADQ